MKKHTHQSGFALVPVLLAVVVLAVIGFVGWRVLGGNDSKSSDSKTSTSTTSTTADSTPKAEAVKPKDPDSPSTMDSPQKVATKDGSQYFYYGAPAGQNNASPKRILITLHGTEGSGTRDYEVWKPLVTNTKYALASLNWWDGSGGETPDYSTPEAMNTQIHDFLAAQGYSSSDIVVFEGFSRGSANSFPIVAHDRASSSPMIDFAVSSSGGAQDAYYGMTTKSIAPKAQSNQIYKGVKWIVACGYKDENPERDGCGAMEKAGAFVSAKGATFLGTLSDKNAGHGALTISSLNLPQQMFDMIEKSL